MASTGRTSMMMLRVRLSRTAKRQPSSISSTATMLIHSRARRARRNPRDIIRMSAAGVEDAVAFVAEGDGGFAVAVDDDGRVLEDLPSGLEQDRHQEAVANRHAAGDEPEKGVEEQAVDDVGEGVGVGHSLRLPAAPDVALPETESAVGPEGQPPHPELHAGSHRHDEGDGQKDPCELLHGRTRCRCHETDDSGFAGAEGWEQPARAGARSRRGPSDVSVAERPGARRRSAPSGRCACASVVVVAVGGRRPVGSGLSFNKWEESVPSSGDRRVLRLEYTSGEL